MNPGPTGVTWKRPTWIQTDQSGKPWQISASPKVFQFRSTTFMNIRIVRPFMTTSELIIRVNWKTLFKYHYSRSPWTTTDQTVIQSSPDCFPDGCSTVLNFDQVHVDDNDSSFGYDPQHSRLLPNIKWSRVVKPLNEPVGSFWNLGGAISPFPPRFGSLAGRLGIGWIWHDSFRLNPFWTVYP